MIYEQDLEHCRAVCREPLTRLLNHEEQFDGQRRQLMGRRLNLAACDKSGRATRVLLKTYLKEMLRDLAEAQTARELQEQLASQTLAPAALRGFLFDCGCKYAQLRKIYLSRGTMV